MLRPFEVLKSFSCRPIWPLAVMPSAVMIKEEISSELKQVISASPFSSV
jgi:hypothetical protein